MARYGFGDLTVEFDNVGGTLVDMSQYVTQVNGFEKEMLIEEITAAGNDDQAWASVGIGKVSDITLSGPFNDTATTGPHAIFNSRGSTRTLKLTIGGTITQQVECIIQKYAIKPTRNALTQFEVTLKPTGAVTET
jgi:hypothetical protein